jgi:hypothetical protein
MTFCLCLGGGSIFIMEFLIHGNITSIDGYDIPGGPLRFMLKQV